MNKLSKEDIIDLYSFLYECETDIKVMVDYYHVNEKKLKPFCKAAHFYRGFRRGKQSY